MEDGAAVRLSSAKNYYGGIRFTIKADSEILNKYTEQIKVFGMIVPTDDITDGAFDGVGEKPETKELTEYTTKEGLNVYYITLTNVLYTNYNRAWK